MDFLKRYRIIEEIGKGRFGNVFKAFDILKNNEVALKVISIKDEHEKNFLVEEFKILSSLSHPNLVEVYDFGISKDDKIFFSMEFLEGKDIVNYLIGKNIDEIIQVILGVLSGLEFIHRNGMIHYDIKPSNIIVSKNIPKITDFGLSLPVNTKLFGKIRGTFGYIAPEIITKDYVDERADLYSFGVVLYQIFTGRMPFSSKEIQHIFKEQMEEKIIPPKEINKNIPDYISYAILKLLSKEPHRRFSSASEVKSFLINEGKSEQLTKFPIDLNIKRFIGREKEIGLIEDGLNNKKSIGIFGESGIGKSELVKHIKTQLQLKGIFTFCASGTDSLESLLKSIIFFSEENIIQKYGKSILYLFPGLKDELKKFSDYIPLPASEEKSRAISHLVSLFKELNLLFANPVYFLEDIHLESPYSLSILKYLLKQNIGVWLCTSSNKEILKELDLDLLIELGSFSEKEMDSFISSIIPVDEDAKEKIVSFSNGNPLTAKLIIRELLEKNILTFKDGKFVFGIKTYSRFEGLTDYLKRRIEGLNQTERKIINILAILKDYANVSIIVNVSKMKKNKMLEAIRELKQKGFITETASGIIFTNSIYKDVIFGVIKDDEKKEIYSSIANYLEEANLAKIDELAEYFYLSGNLEKANYYSKKVIEVMKKSFNYSTALKYIDIALNSLKDDNEKIKLLIDKAETLLYLGKSQEAEGILNSIIDMTGDKGLLIQIFEKLGLSLSFQFSFEKALEVYKKGLSLSEELKNNEMKSRFYLAMGDLYLKKGDIERAEEYINETLKYSENPEVLTRAYNILNNISFIKCDYEKGKKYIEQGLSIAVNKYPYLEAALWGNLGAISHSTGDFTNALIYYEKSLSIHKKIENKRGMGITYGNLGLLNADIYKYKDAINYYLKAAEIGKEAGLYDLYAWALQGVGLVYRNVGVYSKSLEYLEKSAKEFEKINIKTYYTGVLKDMGSLLCLLGEYREGIEKLEIALRITEELKLMEWKAQVLVEYAKNIAKVGRREDAEKCLKESFEIAENLKKDILQFVVIEAMLDFYKDKGNNKIYEELLNRMSLISEKTKRNETLSVYYIKKGEFEGDIESIKKAFEIEKEIKNPERLSLIFFNEGIIYRKMGKEDLSIKSFEKCLEIISYILKGIDEKNKEGYLENSGKKEMFKRMLDTEKDVSFEECMEKIKSKSKKLSSSFPKSPLKLMYEIVNDVMVNYDGDKKLKVILEKILSLLEIKKGAIILFDEDGTMEKKILIAPGNEPVEINLEIVNKVKMKCEEYISFDFLKNIICFPIIVKGYVKGIVYLVDELPISGLTEEIKDVIKILCSFIGLELENASLYNMSIIDNLTKIYSRRYFEYRIEEELNRARRYHSYVSLLMIDIDNFKEFNDQFGHNTGDKILMKIGGVIKESIRASDIPARFGGEEFTIILPETDEKNALLQAERLRRKISEIKIEGVDKNVTVSIGIASFPNHNITNVEDFIDKADKALYQAKIDGKNTSCVYSGKYEKFSTSVDFLRRKVSQMEKERVMKLLEVIGKAISITDVKTLLETSMDLMLELVGAKRGFIMLKDKDGKLEIKVARPPELYDEDILKSVSTSVIKESMKKFTPLLIENALEDDRFKMKESVASLELRSIMCVPFRKEEIEGVIYLDNKDISRIFDNSDLQLLITFTETVSTVLKNAIVFEEIEEDRERMFTEIRSKYSFENIVGKSEEIYRILKTISSIAESDASVLITGESGTGKELVAKAIHYNSKRAKFPFSAINCASIPENLLESELFGYHKGAFTGAVTDKKGILEESNNGTVFFDEISEMSLPLQAKILRFTQSGEIFPIGGAKSKVVNVRIIAATNKNIEELVEQGKFRKDLFFRLNIFNIHLPPLRERKEDIPLLIEHFLKIYCEKEKCKVPLIEKDVFSILMNYDYPGNIRELENIIHRAVILSKGKGKITLSELPSKLAQFGEFQFKETTFEEFKGFIIKNLEDKKKELERKFLLYILEKTKWNVKSASEILGIHRTTLHRFIKKYGLKKN